MKITKKKIILIFFIINLLNFNTFNISLLEDFVEDETVKKENETNDNFEFKKILIGVSVIVSVLFLIYYFNNQNDIKISDEIQDHSVVQVDKSKLFETISRDDMTTLFIENHLKDCNNIRKGDVFSPFIQLRKGNKDAADFHLDNVLDLVDITLNRGILRGVPDNVVKFQYYRMAVYALKLEPFKMYNFIKGIIYPYH